MEALLAILILGGLWLAKSNLLGSSGTVTASGSLTVTPGNHPMVDPNASNQGGPIGNTFLSQTQRVVNPSGGGAIDLPYRPSAVHNGGGIVDFYYEQSDPNPYGSVGSGVSAIEKINAPVAMHTNPPGGFALRSVDTSYGGRSASLSWRISEGGALQASSQRVAAANTPTQPIRGGVAPVNTGGGVRAGANQGSPLPAQSTSAPVVAKPTMAQSVVVANILRRFPR